MQWSSAFSEWGMAAQLSTVRSVSAKATLSRQGAQPESVAFIESGWVKAVRIDYEGQEKTTTLYPPRSLLGAAELIAKQTNPEAVTTLSPCRLHSITVLAFLNRVRTDPQFSEQILRALSRQNYARDIYLAQSKSVPLCLRLQQLIWRLLKAQNRDSLTPNSTQGECKLLVSVRHQELAQMIAITPEHFSRMLRRMENDKIMRRYRGRLIFLDPERLWRDSEIEDLVESDHGQPGKFSIADPIYA